MKAMKSTIQRICWLTVLVAIVAAGTVSIRALDNRPWATAEALGDIAVSFDGVVRIYGNADGLEKGDLTFPSTTAGGLGFDSELNLFVTNTDTNASPPPANQNHVVRFSADAAHTMSTINTQASPRSIAFSGNNTLYVASPGNPATVRRYSYNSQTKQFSLSGQFTAPTDASTCIGIDLAPDQSTLYYVSGGRNVRTVANAHSVTGSATATALTPNLPNPGTACGIRLLPPVDARSTSPRVASAIVGGMLIADARNIKRLDSANAVVQTYNAGSGQDSQKNWVDVALDPSAFHFSAVDAGFSRLARFALSGATPFVVDLPAVPRGVSYNGELRAAQTIRLLTLSSNCTSTATPGCWIESGTSPQSAVSPSFLAGTPSFHDFKVRLEPAAGTSASAFVAVQAVEALSDGNAPDSPDLSGICPASLDLDCRIVEFFSGAKARSYSRGRAVFYMLTELQAAALSDDVPQRTTVVGAGISPGPGAACVPGQQPTQVAVAMIRDKYPHTAPSQAGFSVFEEDITFLVYSDETGTVGRTRNHYVVVDRDDALYSALMVKPVGGSQNLKSTLQIAVEIRNPLNGCQPQPGLNGLLALSITDLTKRTLIVDSEGVSGNPLTSGLSFVETAAQYRANVTVTKGIFTAGNMVRACVNAKADVNNPTAPRAIGEVCAPDVLITGK
jgi:hypothetical protein